MRRALTALAATAGLILAGAGAASANVGDWGTLISETGHTQAESNGGVKQAMVELSWDEVEPGNGQWDTSALNAYKQEVLAHKAAGRKVTLGLGTHYTPNWVFSDLRNTRGVDRYGNDCHDLNVVYSYDARQEIRDYIDHVMNALGPDNIDAVRLTSGGNGELMLSDDTYCAFGYIGVTKLRNSQPSTGQPGTNATTAQHKAWADWYVRSIADAADIQANELRASDHLGWHGRIEYIMPGSGVRPSAFDYYAQQGLPDGLLGLGVAWYKMADEISHRWHATLHQSGVGDGTDNNVGCSAGDSSKSVTDPALDGWSSTRWIAFLADHYGYGASGENPGYGDSVPESYYDNPNGLVQDATGLAKSCNLRAFYWAHDWNLWDNGGLDFSDYASAIQ